MLLSRTLPDDFRSPLTFGVDTGLDLEAPRGPAPLRARCQCGQCAFAVQAAGLEGNPPVLARCYCEPCRRYHVSAFGAYVAVDREAIPRPGRLVRAYEHTCDACGAVERLFCGRCFSVLATVPLEEAWAGRALLALGCVEDRSVPRALALHWQGEFEEWAPASCPPWWTAAPGAPSGPPQRLLRGGCACGGATFEARSGREFQTQHCYCNLCRRLSGSAAQTWVPVGRDGFHWTCEDSVELRRTTSHGQRHVCTRCGGALTIIYDSQPDAVWPAAGSLEDSSLPEDVGGSLCRAIHICCSMMQPWYRLPLDGLPRLRYPG